MSNKNSLLHFTLSRKSEVKPLSEFKIGDFVTHLTTQNILKVIDFGDGSFLKVRELTNGNQKPEEFYVLYFQVKCATSKEIKAGKRLP